MSRKISGLCRRESERQAWAEMKANAVANLMFEKKLDIALQMGLDAAMIANNEVFHMGKGRVEDFVNTYTETFNEMAKMLYEDVSCDPEYVFTKEKVDARLKQICGELFQPWEERYREK